MNGFPTSLVVAALVFVIGLVCNVKGRHFSEDQSAALTQGLGVVCDAIAGIIVWVRNLHVQQLQHLRLLYTKAGMTMPKRPFRISSVIVLPLLMLYAGGCANLSPATNLAIAEQSFTGAVSGLTALHVAGKIDAKTWQVIVNTSIKANAALDVLDQQVTAGVITTNSQLVKSAAWQTVQVALSELTTFNEANANAGSTTRPTSRRPRVQPIISNHSRPGIQGAQLYARAAFRHYSSAA